MDKSASRIGNRHKASQPTSAQLYDEWLVMMAMSGEAGAAERLYRRWNPRLARAARRYGITDEEALDLAQDCWLAIFKGLKKLSNPKRFRSYVFAVLHRRGSDLLRKSYREKAAMAEHTNRQSEARPESISERAAITQAFTALPPDQRIAAHLHFVEGLTLREISEVQQIPEGTAKSRIFNARSKLKAALGPKS